MKTLVFFLKTDKTQSVIVRSFIKEIKILMVTMELTSSEWNFTHSYIA